MRRSKGLKRVAVYDKKRRTVFVFCAVKKRRGQYEWLSLLSFEVVRYALKRLDAAYQEAFRGVRKFPNFHKRRDDESFTLPSADSFSIGNRGIRLPKIGWVKMRPNRGRGDCAVEGTPKMVVVKREAGRWYACVQCEIDAAIPAPHKGAAVGIDMGVAKPYTLSTGKVYMLQRAARLEARRRRYQRIMARRQRAALRAVGWDGKSETRKSAESMLGKKRAEERRVLRESGEYKMPPKYSSRCETAKRRAAKASRKLANIRQNHLHHITSEISREFGMVFVEDLRITNMTASAKGTADEPGKNVAQKRGLNRAILASGWGIMRQQLAYKSEWAGGRMETVAAQNTSRACPECGHIAKENRRTQAGFKCVSCGHRANADVNAAINILRKGLMMEADGEAASGRGDGDSGNTGGNAGVSAKSVGIPQKGKKRLSSAKQRRDFARVSENPNDTSDGVDPPLFCG